MAYDPEGAFAALSARLQSSADFRFTSRRLESWDDTAPAECPAFFLAMGSQTPDQQLGFPPMWRVGALVVLYARNDADPTAAPSIQLNQLIASVVSTLRLQPGEVAVANPAFVARPPGQWSTTLGGRCLYARVAGSVDVAEGLIGGGAIATIPIEMFLSS